MYIQSFLLEQVRRPFSRIDAVADVRTAFCQLQRLLLVLVGDRHQHVAVHRDLDAAAHQCLIQRLLQVHIASQCLPGRLHLRSQHRIHASQLRKREYRRLHEHAALLLRMISRCQPLLAD